MKLTMHLKPIVNSFVATLGAFYVTHQEVNEWLKTLSILAALAVSVVQIYRIAKGK